MIVIYAVPFLLFSLTKIKNVVCVRIKHQSTWLHLLGGLAAFIAVFHNFSLL